MSHTNSTTNYNLPQFLTSDKPAWLTDVNNAFSDIDTAVYAAQSKADTAFTDAGNAQIDATTAINNAAAADAKGSGAIASIEVAFDPTAIYSVGSKVMYNSLLYRCIVAVVTPGPWTGSDNWERINVDTLISTVDSKIGLLSSLSTADKTSIVNAVNEVNNSKVGNWTFVNSTYGSSQISLPTGWNEVYCECRYGNSNGLQAQSLYFILTPDQKGLILTMSGATLTAQCSISSDATKASMLLFTVSGADYLSTSRLRVWYR